MASVMKARRTASVVAAVPVRIIRGVVGRIIMARKPTEGEKKHSPDQVCEKTCEHSCDKCKETKRHLRLSHQSHGDGHEPIDENRFVRPQSAVEGWDEVVAAFNHFDCSSCKSWLIAIPKGRATC